MSANEINTFFIIVFIVLGVFLFVASMIGFLRFPDIYSRAHATSKSPTLGVMFILIAALLFFFQEHGLDARLILGILFILATSPIGSHFLIRASYYSGVSLWENSVRDDLKQVAAKMKSSTLNNE